MESIYTELALYGSKDESARTDNVFCSYLRSAMVRFPFITGRGIATRLGLAAL